MMIEYKLYSRKGSFRTNIFYLRDKNNNNDQNICKTHYSNEHIIVKEYFKELYPLDDSPKTDMSLYTSVSYDIAKSLYNEISREYEEIRRDCDPQNTFADIVRDLQLILVNWE